MTTKVHAYKRIAVSAVVPSDQNPRTHSQLQIDQLARSIREFGFTNPILVDGQNRLIAGHGRLQAAIAERMTTIPAIVLTGLTDAQKRALLIADNKLALNSGWNDDLLRLSMESLKSDSFDLAVVGFSPTDVDAILKAGDFNAGLATDQGSLDTLDPKNITCPHCGKTFDSRGAEA